MNGKKAKAIRRGINEILKKEDPPIGILNKKMPWGQIVNPRRMIYQRFKRIIGPFKIKRKNISSEIVKLGRNNV